MLHNSDGRGGDNASYRNDDHKDGSLACGSISFLVQQRRHHSAMTIIKMDHWLAVHIVLGPAEEETTHVALMTTVSVAQDRFIPEAAVQVMGTSILIDPGLAEGPKSQRMGRRDQWDRRRHLCLMVVAP